jgi:dipeptide/tripeptide permease
MESKIGFWAAFLFPVCVFSVGLAALLSSRDSYIDRPPQGSVVFHAFRVIWIALRSGFYLNAAKPSNQKVGSKFQVSWEDEFVEEIKTALAACKVFLFFPIYWV